MPKNQLHYDQIQNLLCDATEVAHRLEYHDANVLKFQCLFELRNFLNDISDKADIFSSILHGRKLIDGLILAVVPILAVWNLHHKTSKGKIDMDIRVVLFLFVCPHDGTNNHLKDFRIFFLAALLSA